jgi:hypothetical protein
MRCGISWRYLAMISAILPEATGPEEGRAGVNVVPHSRTTAKHNQKIFFNIFLPSHGIVIHYTIEQVYTAPSGI